MESFKTLFFVFIAIHLFDFAVQENVTWDYLVFAQKWPPSFCSYRNCSMPKEVTGWTIHGLWPSSYNGTDVEDCCKEDSCRFNPKLIEDLKDDLNKYWPDLLADKPKRSFWSYEWSKHGTCATNLSALDGEHKYFKKVLELYQKYDVYTILKNGGITPSNSTTYTYEELTKSTKKLLGDKQIKFVCHSTKSHSLLDSVYICLDKAFAVINCPKTNTDCNSHPILYPSYQQHGRSSWYYFAATVLSLSFIALVAALVWLLYSWWKKRQENSLYSTM